MEKRLSRFGVGPKIIVTSLVYAALAFTATRRWPETCLIPGVPLAVFLIAGSLLIALGVLMWLTGLISVMRAYGSDRLVTSGCFALCRHPVYAAWVVLFFPGIALLTRSWPLLLTPFLAYAIFRSLIRVEEDYLAKRFGAAYVEYRARVNPLLPLPKRWARLNPRQPANRIPPDRSSTA